MEKLNGVFIGYKKVQKKDKSKMCNIISFLFLSEDELNQRVTYFVKDVFTDDKIYDNFINEHNVLDFVEVSREIVNDKVRYYI